MQELPRERTAIASTAIGAIRGAIDLATAYVKSVMHLVNLFHSSKIRVLF